jgi:hypothetical protein
MEIDKNCVPGMVNIISYYTLGSAPCRPVKRYIHSFSFTNNLMTQLPSDLRNYALCAMLQGRANFFMDDP